MKRRILLYLLISSVSINMNAQYIPALPSCNVFKNKNEFLTEGNISLYGYHGKLAFSLFKNINLNLNFLHQPKNYFMHLDNSFHRSLDPSVGWCSRYKIFFFEFYSGYGFGKSDYGTSLDPNNHTYTYYNKAFIQLNLGAEIVYNTQCALIIKTCRLLYPYYKTVTFEPSIFVSPIVKNNLYLVFIITLTEYDENLSFPSFNYGFGMKYYFRKRKEI